MRIGHTGRRCALRGIVCGLAACAAALAQPPDADPAAAPIILRDYRVIERVGRAGRTAFPLDPIVARIVEQRVYVPAAGDTVESVDGAARTWQAVAADDEGRLRHEALNGGYAYAAVESAADRVALLDATGHTLVYVNGEPRMGDPYSNGMTRLPVRLRAGTNHLLFAVGRGSLRAELSSPRASVTFHPRDVTAPDLIVGEGDALWAAIPLINAGMATASQLAIVAQVEGHEPLRSEASDVPALSVCKTPFRLPAAGATAVGTVRATLRLLRGDEPLDELAIELAVRRPGDRHRRTFVSAIDGSVQYYAVLPRSGADASRPALVLSAHGASVEAWNQAGAYAAKPWATIVAPTNRRPYGFDWEDTGRLDALEVLAEAQRRFDTDPSRTYLTGHSMGGHGTWHLGVTYPDRWAALGPSAGWISFVSYGGAERAKGGGAIAEILDRAVNGSDTLALLRNLDGLGVYILHGDADDNVPVGQAREMRERLAEFHRDLHYHEQPGAGHWWESSEEPGAECVDWAPMFDLFARRRIPRDDEVRAVAFRTANPGVSARRHWVTIEAQQRPLAISSVQVRVEPGLRRFSGVTENVSRLALDASVLGGSGPISIELDDQRLTTPEPADGRGVVRLVRARGAWSVPAEPPPAWHKGPARSGPFKEVFRNRFVLVYGTGGSVAEREWAQAKARYDAEQFWYRGNGSATVVSDREFDPRRYAGRNVVLYGNAATNAAVSALLGSSPVRVRPGVVAIGDREIAGDDLACLLIRPRADDDGASVGLVGGTGIVGMRLTDRLPYFTSGVAYADVTVLGREAPLEGVGGVRAAGFFGTDWSVEQGDFAFR